MKEKDLTAVINNDQLTISIGLDALKHVCVVGRYYGGGEITITDENEFFKGFLRQINYEKEDGSTLIHHAFDKAVDEMLENGEEGVEFDDD